MPRLQTPAPPQKCSEAAPTHPRRSRELVQAFLNWGASAHARGSTWVAVLMATPPAGIAPNPNPSLQKRRGRVWPRSPLLLAQEGHPMGQPPTASLRSGHRWGTKRQYPAWIRPIRKSRGSTATTKGRRKAAVPVWTRSRCHLGCPLRVFRLFGPKPVAPPGMPPQRMFGSNDR